MARTEKQMVVMAYTSGYYCSVSVLSYRMDKYAKRLNTSFPAGNPTRLSCVNITVEKCPALLNIPEYLKVISYLLFFPCFLFLEICSNYLFVFIIFVCNFCFHPVHLLLLFIHHLIKYKK